MSNYSGSFRVLKDSGRAGQARYQSGRHRRRGIDAAGGPVAQQAVVPGLYSTTAWSALNGAMASGEGETRAEPLQPSWASFTATAWEGPLEGLTGAASKIAPGFAEIAAEWLP